MDELDELVDYEEDAMMTDAIEDAGGEIDMDPVDVEDDHEKLDDDGDEEMTQADNNAPEGTTESVAMTPMPFATTITTITTTDEMQAEPFIPAPEPNLDPSPVPTFTEWPPAPTSIPPVPSRLPEATLIPPEVQHEEGKLDPLNSRSELEVNSIAAEPPASPSRTVVSTSFVLPGTSTRPPSPPVGGEGTGGVMLVPGSTEGVKEEDGEVAVQGESNGEGEVVHETVDVAASTTDGAVLGEGAGSAGTTAAVEEAKRGSLTEASEQPENDTKPAEAVGIETETVKVDAHPVDGAVVEDGEEDGVHADDEVPLTEEADHAEHDPEEHDHDELSEEQEDEEEQEQEQDEETGEPKFSPIVIEIISNALRPLFFPLSEHNAELCTRFTRPDSDDWECEPYDPLLPGLADELYKAPLRDVFVALRARLGEEWDESRGTEMILHERNLGLKIGEDNKYTDTLSLHDLADLHSRCNCTDPLTLSIEYDSVRFIAKYNAIKKVLDSSAAPPGVDSSSDEDEDNEETGEIEYEDDENEHDEHEGDDLSGDHDHVLAYGAVSGETSSEQEDVYVVDGAEADEEDAPEESTADGPVVASASGLVNDDSAVETVEAVEADTTSPLRAESKEPKTVEPEIRDTLTSVPLPAKTAETLNADSNQTSTATLEEDELEDQDDEDGASETNGADEFGIDAAVRQTERDADLAEIADATPDDQPPNNKDLAIQSSTSAPTSDNGLKRALDTEQAADNERSVKRKLSPEPVTE